MDLGGEVLRPCNHGGGPLLITPDNQTFCGSSKVVDTRHGHVIFWLNLVQRSLMPATDPAITKGLNDKFYEKRKAAALELEKRVSPLVYTPVLTEHAGWCETATTITNNLASIPLSTK